MLPGMRRGPKPTMWRDAASAGFAAHFARRSEPLNLPEEAPLAEATGAGLRWIFTGFGTRQVRIASGGSVRNIALGVTGTLLVTARRLGKEHVRLITSLLMS
eukprot:1531422-Prymnesium_polylepis.1